MSLYIQNNISRIDIYCFYENRGQGFRNIDNDINVEKITSEERRMIIDYMYRSPIVIHSYEFCQLTTKYISILLSS